MSNFTVWTVTANHGYYGSAVLLSRMSCDKRQAICQCLRAVRDCVREDDKTYLANESNAIINSVLENNEYEQGDDGLRVIAELHDMSVNFSATFKAVDDQ